MFDIFFKKSAIILLNKEGRTGEEGECKVSLPPPSGNFSYYRPRKEFIFKFSNHPIYTIMN